MEISSEDLIQWRKQAAGINWDPELFRSTRLTDSIAAAERFADCARRDGDGTTGDPLTKLGREFANLGAVMSWFRDKVGLETIGQMFDHVANRHVPLEVVALWADELFSDAMPACELEGAIRTAYPEVGERMELRQQQRIAESLDRARKTIEDM